MRRISIMASATLILSAFVYVYNQTPRRGVSGREDTSSRPPVARAEIPKGTLLVEKLPADVEGVVLEKGVIKIQPGYKFVKKDNKVTVMSMSSGAGAGGRLGVGGSWSCVCKQGIGGCSTMVQDNQIYCAPGGEPACPDKCVLSIVIKAAKSEIIRY